MSLLEKASLVVTPNAYKESKLYSVIPNTTLGDMDVVRATTATRVNEQGLIEVVPRNLLTYSNDFSNGIWTKYQSSVVANDIISPDGILNGTKLNVLTTAYSGIYATVTGINQNYAISIYIKKGNKDWAYIFNADATSACFFNISNGTLGTIPIGCTASIIDDGNGWYRCTVVSNTSAVYFQFGFSDANNSFTPDSNGYNYIYGAQLEQGSTATTYFPTTDRLNIPRIDYTNGSCPSLLVEPQRTNLVPNPFAYSGSQVAFNSTVANSPITGGLSTRITKNEVAGTLRYASQTCSAIALRRSTAYTISAFFKYDGYNVQTSMEYNNSNQWGTTSWQQIINIASTGITLGTSSACTSTIQNYNNGWYRVNIKVTTGAAISGTPPVNYLMQVASSLSTGQGFLHTAAQLEVGSYQTSYIPTVSSSITRNADVISKTGISSLIGQTEGTVFANIDYDSNVSGTKIITGLALDASSFIYSFISETTLVLSIYNGGTLQCYLTYALPSSGKYKIAIGYKLNDFIIYVNGINVASQTSGTVPTCSILYLGNDFLTVYNKLNYDSVQLYKTRLTNAELTQLTTI